MRTLQHQYFHDHNEGDQYQDKHLASYITYKLPFYHLSVFR